MTSLAAADLRRCSIEKGPIVVPRHDDPPPAFERLPDEIIQQYLCPRALPAHFPRPPPVARPSPRAARPRLTSMPAF